MISRASVSALNLSLYVVVLIHAQERFVGPNAFCHVWLLHSCRLLWVHWRWRSFAFRSIPMTLWYTVFSTHCFHYMTACSPVTGEANNRRETLVKIETCCYKLFFTKTIDTSGFQTEPFHHQNFVSKFLHTGILWKGTYAEILGKLKAPLPHQRVASTIYLFISCPLLCIAFVDGGISYTKSLPGSK